VPVAHTPNSTYDEDTASFWNCFSHPLIPINARGHPTLQNLKERRRNEKSSSKKRKIVDLESVVIYIKCISGDIICIAFNDASLV